MKTKTAPPKNIKISVCFSLQYLLDTLKSEGVSEKDFDKVEFDKDYGDCYYEGDEPSIVAVFSENLIKK